MARTIKLTLAYDGTEFAGWQLQPGLRTLQGTLEDALAKITGRQLRVFASGRTDAGVHAIGQVVSFDTESALTANVLFKALNAELPHDMAAVSVEDALPDFNARREAKRKRYRYQICDGRMRDVFRRRYAWQIYRRLDAEAMSSTARSFIGKHDFASFETSGSERETTVRTVFDLTVERAKFPEEHVVQIEVEADGFLYNMVRILVGTLVEVGQGRQTENWVNEVLAALDRRRAGPTAPPQGLCLIHVGY